MKESERTQKGHRVISMATWRQLYLAIHYERTWGQCWWAVRHCGQRGRQCVAFTLLTVGRPKAKEWINLSNTGMSLEQFINMKDFLFWTSMHSELQRFTDRTHRQGWAWGGGIINAINSRNKLICTMCFVKLHLNMAKSLSKQVIAFLQHLILTSTASALQHKRKCCHYDLDLSKKDRDKSMMQTSDK